MSFRLSQKYIDFCKDMNINADENSKFADILEQLKGE